MSESSSRPAASSASALVPLAVAAAVVAVDQLTKHWAVNALGDGHAIDLIGSLRLKLTFNSGASFSIGSGRGGLIATAGFVVLVVAFRAVVRWPGRLAAVGLGITVGGALGNLVDRVLRAGDGFLGGHVVDFVDLQWWPVFNVADVAIYTGGGLLVLASLRHRE